MRTPDVVPAHGPCVIKVTPKAAYSARPMLWEKRMKIMTATALAIVLGASPALAGGHGHGHGGGHGGHGRSASTSSASSKSRGQQSKADKAAAKAAAKAERKAEKAAAKEAKQAEREARQADKAAQKAARKAAKQGVAVETGLWHITQFVDAPSGSGYRYGDFDMSSKGKFTGWTYGLQSDEKVTFSGKVNLKSLSVKGKTEDGYKLSGHYTPYPIDVSAVGKQLMAGDLLGKGKVSLGTFDAEGALEQELP